MKKAFVFLLAFFVTSLGCKDDKKKDSETQGLTESKVEKTKDVNPGKKLLENECYLCHSPSMPEEGRLAPPMIAIKKHYINDTTSKEQFRKDMIAWINNPSTEISKMPGALKKFGVMPLQPYPEEKILLMADYLYDNEIDEPEWFQDHYQKEHGKGNGIGKNKESKRLTQEEKYSNLGLKYAMTTKAQLGKNLMGAIKQNGTVAAVEFCNHRAMKLTDSMSVMHNAIIKRVSDKPRNQENKANSTELGHIEAFKNKIKENGVEVEPIVETSENEVNFYFPITTNTMCLQCHGQQNNQVKENTLSTLKSLYPNDKAMGYDVGQVRGIWSISFLKETVH